MESGRIQTQTERLRHNACVMLVEDDQHIGEALTHLLKDKGYRVDRCFDGREALAHLRAGTAPDIILLDLMMPNLNGWEFRVEQRRDPEWSTIPVIVMSADPSPQASAIDADDYLRKPVAAAALLASVDRLLQAQERARLETRTAELDRMNSLGVLAAGLAHEINNPLAFVSGNLELAKVKCSQLESYVPAPDQESVRSLGRMLDQAQRGAERIADVVRGVSTFARPDTEQVVPMNVQDVLESSLQLVANEIRHHARLEREYTPVPTVMGNPAKLGQVLINLLINAVHAIGQGDAAQNTIRVATRVGADAQVVISITDSGSGIAPEIVGRIFDPFFSTKAIGSGMGLGLSICQRLVSNMGGNITVDSAPGRGSTFAVSLPHREHGMSEVRAPAVVKTAATDKRASVLVIDDETMMCELLRNMLQDEYEVTTLSSSRAALERMLKAPLYEVVLCDLMMPELTGMDLYGELMRKRPEQAARFVFMTGGTFTDRASEFLDTIDAPPLTKPFRNDELRRAIVSRLRQFEAVSDRAAHRTYN